MSYNDLPNIPPGPPRPPAGYESATRHPLLYLPVVRQGELMGYLWGSKSYGSAGFVRRLKFDSRDRSVDPFSDPSLRCSFVWTDRLAQSYEDHLSPHAALVRWKGAPEHPEGGYIPADAVELEARNLAELYEVTNPGGPPPPEIDVQDGMFADGTPADRSQGWGPVGGYVRPTYAGNTVAAVRFTPVVLNGEVLGYIWASVAEDAAGYLARAGAGQAGLVASSWWRGRLSDWFERGVAPTSTLTLCRQVPANEFGGVAPSDAPHRELPSLSDLVNLAQRE